MAASVLYHCPHTDPLPDSPPSLDPATVDFHHHPLSSLLFCEECDAIRCDRCITGEVSCYYCPNCLFEVTAASVRAERNRCARNCFLCPSCDHTLSIVASDPSPSSVTDLRSAPASVGEPPYFLACSFCRWDSKQVGITFEKPTGLTLQLQKQEEESPDRLEFDRLRDHFEPFLKAQLAALQHQSLQGAPTTTSHHNTSSARQNAASAALLKDIPSLAASSRYTSVLASTSLSRLATGRSHSHTHLSAAAESKEDLADYRSLVGSKDLKGKGKSREDERVEFLREGISTGGLDASATLDKRWTDVWDPPSRSSDLRPLRVPLRSKQTKRCPSCTHILIRPEQKAQSTRFKIKLMANMFLPAIEMSRRTALSNLPSRLTAAATAAGRRGGARASMAGPGGTAGPGGAAAGKEKEEEALRQGRTYTFELSFVNPLYEPITVRLALPAPPTSSGDDTTPPFTISLPASSFSIAAFAEVWEYDDEDEDDAVDDGQGAGGGDAKRSRLSVGGSSLSSKRRDAPGVLERKANRTTVAVEVAIGKDFLGPLKTNLLVTYTYQSDDAADESRSKKASSGSADGEKSFTFWTALTFGNVVARPAGLGPRQSIMGLRTAASATPGPV